MIKTAISNNRAGREWLVNAGLLLSLLALCVHLHGAATINFQSTPFIGADEQSDGTAMDSTFSFQLGTFDVDPTTISQDQWFDHWTPAQLIDGDSNPIAGNAVSYDDSEAFGPGSGLFVNNVEATAQLDDNDGVFAEGSQGYIWGYTTRDDGVQGEWILLTNADWQFPAADPPPGGQPANELWLTTDAGTIAVLGSLDPANGGGSGYELQSAPALVPEPSSGLLLLAGAAVLGMRRRRIG